MVLERFRHSLVGFSSHLSLCEAVRYPSLKLSSWELTSSKIYLALYEFPRAQIAQECLIILVYWKNYILVHLRLQIHAFQKSIKIVLQFWYSFWYSFGTVLIQFWYSFDTVWYSRGTVVRQFCNCIKTVPNCIKTVSSTVLIQFDTVLIQFRYSLVQFWYSCSTVSQLYINCTKTVSKLYQTVSKMCPKIRVRPCWKNAGRVSGDPQKV